MTNELINSFVPASIPRDLLLKLENTYEDDDAGAVSNSEARRGALGLSFHYLFVTFMTISALSMWISFLPIQVRSRPPL